MATGGDAGWIPAALERLLPDHLKQKAGVVQEIEAKLQVRGRGVGRGPGVLFVRPAHLSCVRVTTRLRRPPPP